MVGLDAGRSREGTATGQLAREEAKGGVCVCVINWSAVFNDDQILGVIWKLAFEKRVMKRLLGLKLLDY